VSVRTEGGGALSQENDTIEILQALKDIKKVLEEISGWLAKLAGVEL